MFLSQKKEMNGRVSFTIYYFIANNLLIRTGLYRILQCSMHGKPTIPDVSFKPPNRKERPQDKIYLENAREKLKVCLWSSVAGMNTIGAQ